MKNILAILVILCTFGCSHKILILDYESKEAIPQALVLVEKSHYPFAPSTVEAYKTDENGFLTLSYSPSYLLAGKYGYNIAHHNNWKTIQTSHNTFSQVVDYDEIKLEDGSIPHIYFLTKESNFDSYYKDYEIYERFARNFVKYHLRRLPKTSPFYTEWKDLLEHIQGKMQKYKQQLKK